MPVAFWFKAMFNLLSEVEIRALWKEDWKDPLVSICCITFNHEEYISDTLIGFLSQKTDFPFEILIHDDASTDATAEIIRKYVIEYPTIIKPIYQKENQYRLGRKGNVSFNFPRAKGKYLAMCEGDDYWISEDKLRVQVGYMEKHKFCVLTFHGVRYLVGNDFKGNYYAKPKFEEISIRDAILKHYVPSCSAVYRRETVQNAVNSCKALPTFIVGDIPLIILVLRHGYARFFDSEMGVYRKNVNSLTHDPKHLKRARKGMILLYLGLLPCVPIKEHIFVYFNIAKLLLGYLKPKSWISS